MAGAGILDAMATRPLDPADLAEVLHHGRSSFETLRGARLFITGGTGFFGHWLLETLLHAEDRLGLKLRATVLTRDATAFRSRSPFIAEHSAISLLQGDMRSFAYPAEPHTHIVHAATDSGGRQAEQPAFALAEGILAGTQHVLRFARHTGARRLLYVSSGAVYGRSTTLPHTPETYLGGPDPLALGSSYDEAKRMAEHLCVAFAEGTALQPVIARCFAFVGPHLPLDAHFAIGNFIGAALRGDSLHIRGDGTPRRSWLYMADLATWLWTLLVNATPNRAYNVGSDEAYTIADAARLVQRTLAPGSGVRVDGTPLPGSPLNSYVPSIDRVQQELGLRVRVPLADALQRTAAWHRGANRL